MIICFLSLGETAIIHLQKQSKSIIRLNENLKKCVKELTKNKN